MYSRRSMSKVFLILLVLVCFTGCPPKPPSTPSNEAQITAFSFASPPVTATIDNFNNLVTVEVPLGTDRSRLIPTISVSPGATIAPASGLEQDFTYSVAYTVTAADGETTRIYTVIVNMSMDPLALFGDNFTGSVVDSSKWSIPTWVSSNDGTYVGQTQFRCSQNASLPAILDGSAMIALDTYNPTGASFYGTDLISDELFYLEQGISVTVRARMDESMPAGVVCGIFLYAKPKSTANTLHDEIDFELLSNDPYKVSTNIYGNESLGIGHPAAFEYNYGSATDFHDYTIDWLPGRVSWYVDDVLIRTVTNQSPIPVGPMYLHLNVWVPGSDFSTAYNPNLHWTNSASSNQTYYLIVDSVTVLPSGS